MEIKKTELGGTCNCCNNKAQHDLKIGIMVNRLCSDCLAELIGKAVITLANNKEV